MTSAREFDLAKRAEREAAAEAIADAARACGATVVVENWDGEPDVDITMPNLRATIWLGYTQAAPMPIISWYGATWPLASTVPGAWTEYGLNHAHGRKASSLPRSWPELFEALEAGLLASLDGSAFEGRGA